MSRDVMPVFAIKARDNLAPMVIARYVAACREAGLHEQADQVEIALREILDWREDHRDLCKWPDHAHIPAGEPGSGSLPSA